MRGGEEAACRRRRGVPPPRDERARTSRGPACADGVRRRGCARGTDANYYYARRSSCRPGNVRSRGSRSLSPSGARGTFLLLRRPPPEWSFSDRRRRLIRVRTTRKYARLWPLRKLAAGRPFTFRTAGNGITRFLLLILYFPPPYAHYNKTRPFGATVHIIAGPPVPFIILAGPP